MSGPWERYAQPKAEDGPWSKFAPAKTNGGALDTAKDAGASFGSGIARGAAELAMAPVTIPRLVRQGVDWAVSQLPGAAQGPMRENAVDRAIYGPQDAARAAMDATLYAPRTTVGKYARTVGEFIPGALLPGATVGNAVRFGVVPGLASEAAGQATEGTALEPWARAGAGIAAGVGMAALQRPGSGQQALEQMAGGPIPRAQLDAADALMAEAASRGIQLTPIEALNQVTNGAYSRLAQAQRVVEQSQGGAPTMGAFMAERPGQVTRAAGQAFDQFAPNPTSPSAVGASVRSAAGQAVRATPEGMLYDEALALNAPRTTAGDAGPVMQQGLARVADRREGMRAALADQEYGAARATPGTIPLNGGHRIGTVHSVSEPRSIPILINDAEREAARQASLREASRFEQMPIVGERATLFGQADPRSVLQGIDAALETAKGAPRQALEAAKRALMRTDGTPDFSITGLDASRKAITDLIDQAASAGARNTVRELQGVLGQLDEALARVPAYGRAKQGFEAASQPLRPFDDARPLGQIVQRDQYGKEFVRPADQAPGLIDRAGAQGAREFAEVAPAQSREAYVNYLTSRLVDAASDQAGMVDLNKLRSVMAGELDQLRAFPEAADRLLAIARSRQALQAGPEASMTGRLAREGNVTAQRGILFPAVPEAGSAQEVGRAVSQVARQNPKAASDLVGQHARTVFAEAAQSNMGGANQFGGAKFAAQIAGNAEQAASLEAAVRALPGGDTKWQGFRNFLDVLEATGKRLTPGSPTSPNMEIVEQFKAGSTAARTTTTGGFGFFREIARRWDIYQLSRNTDAMADLLTSRNASGVFGRLARENGVTPAAQGLALKLLSIAGTNAAQAEKANARPVPQIRQNSP